MSENILIVDDEKEIADLLELYLKNDGYNVFKCYNGTDAGCYIKDGKIDFAVLDVMLPDTDGFTLLKTIRGNKLLSGHNADRKSSRQR